MFVVTIERWLGESAHSLLINYELAYLSCTKVVSSIVNSHYHRVILVWSEALCICLRRHKE